MNENFELDLLPIRDKDIIEFTKTIDSLFVNGGSIFKHFQIKNFSLFCELLQKSENSLDDLFHEIFFKKNMEKAIPEFNLENDYEDGFNFSTLSKENIFKELLQLLLNGGAYKRFEQKEEIAKQLVNNFLKSFIGKRFYDFRIYVSYEPWNNWYNDVAWDYTYIFIDTRKEELFILCITDTD